MRVTVLHRVRAAEPRLHCLPRAPTQAVVPVGACITCRDGSPALQEHKRAVWTFDKNMSLLSGTLNGIRCEVSLTPSTSTTVHLCFWSKVENPHMQRPNFSVWGFWTHGWEVGTPHPRVVQGSTVCIAKIDQGCFLSIEVERCRFYRHYGWY